MSTPSVSVPVPSTCPGCRSILPAVFTTLRASYSPPWRSSPQLHLSSSGHLSQRSQAVTWSRKPRRVSPACPHGGVLGLGLDSQL